MADASFVSNPSRDPGCRNTTIGPQTAFFTDDCPESKLSNMSSLEAALADRFLSPCEELGVLVDQGRTKGEY